jgi:pimeloyl-ACP methyl ester carboxylesterase
MSIANSFKRSSASSSIVSSVAAFLVSVISVVAPVASVGVAALAYSGTANAVTCGSFDGKVCSGTAYQYAGGFSPNAGESGGFGGASGCTVTHTPVIFIHGNGDNATSWDAPTFQVSGYAKAPNSVYQQFKAAGYKDCELFGVTYLNSSERASPQYNTHTESKYAIIERFIRAVKLYTGKSQVDLVTHSLGVTMSMTALTYYGDWGSVRRFVNIAGGIHGLDSCLYTGYANPYATTCDSQNWYDSYWFGFFPDSWSPGINPWTGTSAWYAFANSGLQHTATSFYTIYAGTHDEVHCTTVSDYANCGKGPLLKANTNVKAQLNVGAGSNAQQVDWSWSDYSMFNLMGGDTNGVGHFHAKSNTGQIIVNMLNTSCTGTGCASGYAYGPVQ